MQPMHRKGLTDADVGGGGQSEAMATGMMRTLLVLGVSTFLLTVGGGPAAAIIDDPDVDTSAEYLFRVSPEEGLVEVTIDLAVTADKPNRSAGGGGYYEYYFQGYFLVIPEEAVDLTVTDPNGRELNYVIDEEVEDVKVLEIDFRRNIFYRQTANIVVNYTLPAGAARSDALTRVNEAYAGFEIWLTPQIEEANVSVITPFGFDDRSTGSEPFTNRLQDGESLFVAEDVDPETFWSLVSLARDDSLTVTEVEIGDHTVEISSWPGDDVWTEHVTTNLENGLPTLIEQVGLPWPIEGELAIIESYSPYLSGYAGWYDPNTDEIEIGDQLDSHLVFHELSHVWFNPELFDQRWITEGLADVFGAAVVESLGDEPPMPDRTSLVDGSAQPLNQWTTFTSEADVETWSYGASWTVTQAIVDEVGLETMSAAIQSAANDRIAYLGDGEAERGPKRRDWRFYLDLIENHGEVTDGKVSELFADWALLGTQRSTLDVRATSRTAYRELVESGDEWAPPFTVRKAMSDWRFDDADELIAESQALIGRRDDVVRTLTPVDAELPTDLERGFESGDDLEATGELLSDVAEAADQLRATNGRIEGIDGPLQWVGALGTDHRSDFDGAVSAFERNRLTDSIERSQTIDGDIERLTTRGLIRTAAAVGGLLIIALIISWLVRRRKRNRQTRSSAVEPAGQAPEVASPPPPDNGTAPTQSTETPQPSWAPPMPSRPVSEAETGV